MTHFFIFSPDDARPENQDVNFCLLLPSTREYAHYGQLAKTASHAKFHSDRIKFVARKNQDSQHEAQQQLARHHGQVQAGGIQVRCP